MKYSRLVVRTVSLAAVMASAKCFAILPNVAPVAISDFSAAASLVTFGGFDGPADSLTVGNVKLNDLTDGFLVLQEGGAIPDAFFGNIPGASKGGYGKTTATLLLKILFDLPTPTRRFGILISTGGPESYQVSAISNGLSLGSVVATQPGRNQAVFAGVQSSTPFEQVYIEQLGSGGMTSAFDDLRFELVPEPPTGTALGVLATLALLARRRLLP